MTKLTERELDARIAGKMALPRHEREDGTGFVWTRSGVGLGRSYGQQPPDFEATFPTMPDELRDRPRRLSALECDAIHWPVVVLGALVVVLAVMALVVLAAKVVA